MADKPALRILEINAAARYDGSISRKLAADLSNALADRLGNADVKRRDLAKGLPFIDEEWVTETPLSQFSAEIQCLCSLDSGRY